jgi:hypothetical protein
MAVALRKEGHVFPPGSPSYLMKLSIILTPIYQQRGVRHFKSEYLTLPRKFDIAYDPEYVFEFSSDQQGSQ